MQSTGMLSFEQWKRAPICVFRKVLKYSQISAPYRWLWAKNQLNTTALFKILNIFTNINDQLWMSVKLQKTQLVFDWT